MTLTYISFFILFCSGMTGAHNCANDSECYANGNECDGIPDAMCVCKNGHCKTSRGCGVMGAFFKTECSTCDEADCEDSGACFWDSTNCREIPEAISAKEGDNKCVNDGECYANGNLCDGIPDAMCVCKNEHCKTSPGCGVMGAFFKTECAACNEEDCEDYGACYWDSTKCIEAPEARPVEPGTNVCATASDCRQNGNLCDGLADATCICKNNACKISSGCGVMGAFFTRECSTCNEEDCEDEDACGWDASGRKCFGFIKTVPTDLLCTEADDCSSKGKPCYSLADAYCVCKNNRCKISSGCGRVGAFFNRECSSCNQEDCADEGLCVWMRGTCRPATWGGK